jgi:type II secretory pathway component PulM
VAAYDARQRQLSPLVVVGSLQEWDYASPSQPGRGLLVGLAFGVLLVIVWVVVWAMTRSARRPAQHLLQHRAPHEQPPRFDDL